MITTTKEHIMKMKIGVDRDPFEWVLMAKGIGIILVVVGHFSPETSPTYWLAMKKIIYSFHMPLFFILSGYLYSHGKYSYRDLIKTKVKRLLYPFVTIAVAFLLIKYAAGRVVNLEYPVNINSIYALLLNPIKSYMPLLWFVHALFLMFATYPLARLFLNNLSILLLLLVTNTILGSDYLVFGKMLANMPFFVVGIILRENGILSKITISADWRYTFALVVMFFLAYVMIPFSIHIVPVYPTRFFLGVVGSWLVINICLVLSAKKIHGVLLPLGYYSMTIYLLHPLFESTVRIAFLQVFKHTWVPFEMIAGVAIICGIVFPLVLEKEVLRKYWITRKFVLGLA